ncbi:phosphoglycolate phosphatase [Oxalobacteraceae bacterium GrIS 2.11]
MNSTLKLVMFDLDGTLVETGTEIALAVNDTLRHFDLPAVSEAQVFGWIGKGTRELLIQSLAGSMQSDSGQVDDRYDLAQILAEFGRHYERRCGTNSRLYPKVRETLTELKAAGVKLAIVTNKDMHYTNIVLRDYQLNDFFDLVIGGDSLPTKKPDPAGILHCLSTFRIDAEQALFIGDSSIDAAAARSANVAVWLLPYGYNMNQSVQTARPDRVIDDIASILEFDFLDGASPY